MEPERSFPLSQVPITCPYPKPARSSPYPHIPVTEDSSSFIETNLLLLYSEITAVCYDIHKIRKVFGQNVDHLKYPRGT
jgi:hypothetical protein